MRAVVVKESFGVENLATITREDAPAPGPGQVALTMRAATLNYRDLMMVRGHYNPRQPLPLVPCSDGVGVVEAVGEGVTRVAVGDRVCPIFAQGWLGGEPRKHHVRTTLGGPLDGTLREEMVLDQEGVVKVPGHLSDAEAAALPCAGVTAWRALEGVGPGQTVLLQGTGGVSIFALQFAKARGARAIITSSSDAKLEVARELGADATINYRERTDWGRAAKELTGGEGVDRIVEVGGAGTLAESMRAAKVGAEIAVIGVLSGSRQELDVTPILMRGLRLRGIFVGSRDDFERMNRAIAHHELRPVVRETFALEDARAAFERMASGGHLGKIAIRHAG
jgi:NADPH:quinone reductase-like Zn-dependent oxidoreductase